MNASPTPSPPVATHQPVRRARILCVDDDPNVSSAIARSIRTLGVDVMRAYNGIQGYWQLVTKRPDAVVVDLKMPEADGEELIDCLMGNETTRLVPVIVLSGNADHQTERRLLELGVSGVLHKPASVRDLLWELSHHINLPERALEKLVDKPRAT